MTLILLYAICLAVVGIIGGVVLILDKIEGRDEHN